MIDYKMIPPGFTNSGFLCLTNACNLRCVYCFVKQNPDYMTLETALDAVEFINKFRTKQAHYQFFGGEPLLMWDKIIVPVLEYVEKKKYDIRFGITTNCTLLTEDKLKIMKKYKVDLLTSIDGPREIQDAHRPCADGSSSFDLVMKNLPKIKEYYPDTVFRATMTPDTTKDLYDCIMFAKDLNFRKIFIMPDEFLPMSESQVSALEEGIYKYMLYYIENYSKPRLPYDFIELNNFIFEIKNAYRLEDFKGPMIGGRHCGLSLSNVSINWNGELLSCQQTSSRDPSNPYHIGSIYLGVDSKKLGDLWGSYIGKEIRGQDKEMCKDCIRRAICREGFCHSNSSANGDITIKGKSRCIYDSLLLKYAILARSYLKELQDSVFYNAVETIELKKKEK